MTMEDLLKELQQEYIDGLPEKISELEEFFQQKDLQNLINSFHKLKGSGKTYGLEEVSVLGELLENWLREKGDEVIPFIAPSIEILKRIYNSRVQSAPYNISADEDFKNLSARK